MGGVETGNAGAPGILSGNSQFIGEVAYKRMAASRGQVSAGLGSTGIFKEEFPPPFPPPPHRSQVPGAKTTKRLRSEPGWAGRPIQNSSARIGHDQSQRSFGPSRPAVLFFSRGLVSRNHGPFVRLCPVQRQGKVSSGITLGVDTQERGSCWGVGLSPWHRRGQG